MALALRYSLKSLLFPPLTGIGGAGAARHVKKKSPSLSLWLTVQLLGRRLHVLEQQHKPVNDGSSVCPSRSREAHNFAPKVEGPETVGPSDVAGSQSTRQRFVVTLEPHPVQG
ncbi:hypothetical protein B0H15DRAFT_807261 [Mycena belliarum]|uniref:Uncharacterized protein n=1 Tax=Mycena belliarum TaxID=1033014 RepID=A0AAD6TLG5_9AGAR|nr:hypothetical protein B0H15DRAFT_807261 [Mycena belliae]